MQTTSLGLKKPDGDDIIDIQDFNDNADIIDAELAKRPFKTGDASNMTNTFSQAASLTNLTPGETQKISFGKLMKAIADYVSHKATAATASALGHVKFGSTAGTACQGNDSRLSNSRTPTAHASTATTYGQGNNSHYGHVRLSDTYATAVGNGAAANGLGASQKALADSYFQLNYKLTYSHGLKTYTTTNMIPGYEVADANITLSGLYATMPAGSLLQKCVWRNNWTSFSFPAGATGSYLLLTVQKGDDAYGSVTLHDLDQNAVYVRSRYGGVWNDWKPQSPIKRIVYITVSIGSINSNTEYTKTIDLTSYKFIKSPYYINASSLYFTCLVSAISAASMTIRAYNNTNAAHSGIVGMLLIEPY